jgi:hypothetical protein
MKANDVGWPSFDGRFVNYTKFKREWRACQQTFHAMMGNDLAAKTLREKCVSRDVQKMIGNLEDLAKIWDTLDMYYKRPENYMAKALKPIVEFRRYRITE